MTYNRKILAQAALEYHSIIGYLTSTLSSPQAAKDSINEFEHQLNLVCEMPMLYGLSKIEELAVLGYRSFLVKKYIAIYKIKGNCVIVAHIFHQSQDYAKFVL